MAFLHPGSGTRIHYLHISENQQKLHQKFTNIFGPIREMCR